jgi:hypothetical protein
MKTREGFVSNSSSANFVLNKKYFTEGQIQKILECNKKDLEHEGGYSECWHIRDEGDTIVGSTIMDNDILRDMIYDMNPRLKAIIDWTRDG